MHKSKMSSGILGMVAGVGVTACAALLMGQGAQPGTTPPAQPPQPAYPTQARGNEYFVTGDGSTAHLWVREGMNLRHVADADTTRAPGKNPADKTPPDWKDRDRDGKPMPPK